MRDLTGEEQSVRLERTGNPTPASPEACEGTSLVYEASSVSAEIVRECGVD